MSHRYRSIAIVTLLLGMFRPVSAMAAEEPLPVAVPGELRLFAIDSEQRESVDTLHRAGWLEADGRLVPQKDFPELYSMIGRSWTQRPASKDLFALPNLVDQRKERDPYGVLSPGDLVTGGRTKRLPPLTYFVYMGRDARSVTLRIQ